MDPAKEVGGDFYDFFLIDENRLGLVMADVSGKGVPAALFMMASKILVKNFTMAGLSPEKVLEKVNNQICANNPEQMFVTIWLGILDLTTGVLTASNAGHEYPVIKQPGGAFALLKDKHSFPVGGIEGIKYGEYEIRLEPRGRLFVYTDGVPEATDAQNQLFGTERMLNALNEAPDAPVETVLQNVRQAVDRFVGGAEQFDDLTMMCVIYNGKE
jgi:sigma-B regulation protein RsbU (phosphoserine phosphatase)